MTNLLAGPWRGAAVALRYFSLRFLILIGFVFIEAALVLFVLLNQYLDGQGNSSFDHYEEVAIEARLAEQIALDLQIIVRTTERYVATGDVGHVDHAKTLTEKLGSTLSSAEASATSFAVTDKIALIRSALSTFGGRLDRLVELRSRYSRILASSLQPLIHTMGAELALLNGNAWELAARDVAIEIGHANESLLLIDRRVTTFIDQPGNKTASAMMHAVQQLNETLQDLSVTNVHPDVVGRIEHLIGLGGDAKATVRDLATSAFTYRYVTKRIFEQNIAEAEKAAQELADDATTGLVNLGQATRAEFAEAERLQLLYAIGAFIVSLAFASLLGGEISRSVRRMAATMRQLAEGDSRIDIDHLDNRHELGDMARSVSVFRENALQIERMNEELRQHAKQLEVSLEKEQEVNAQQRRFVTMVCHEFRTPLSIIDGIATWLERKGDDLTLAKRNRKLTQVRESVARLIELIESNLSSARLEAGSIELQRAPFDLAALVEEVCTHQQDISKHHQIVADLDALPDQFSGDEKLLRQVATNLLSNAVKYSPDNKLIHVSGTVADGHAVIAVRDHGVGIPEQEIPKLFTRFFRASTATNIGGTGIGLHLAKSLVEMHHGSVEVTSVEGEGSTFIIRLPLELPMSPVEQAA